MSKRNKRKAAKNRPRGPVAQPQREPSTFPTEATASPVASAAPTAAAPRPAAPVPAYASGVTAPRRAAAVPAVSIDIDERVPHFSQDLRRIAITAGVMFAIVIIASLLVH